MKLLDAHNHIHFTPLNSSDLENVRCICNGTSLSDWAEVAAAADTFSPAVIPYFGVHPWFLDALSGNWEESLKKYLRLYPFGVGEIGLDRSRRGGDLLLQEKIFTRQLEIAFELELPVSLHCVGVWGKTVEILTRMYAHSSLPFMIHSFSGSIEIMEKLSIIGAYFSFSPAFLKEEKRRLRDILMRVPLHRILFETDFPSGVKKGTVYREVHRKILLRMYTEGSLLKETDLHEFIGVINTNGKIFTDRAASW